MTQSGRDLLDRIKTVAKDLDGLSKWQSSGSSFGHLHGKERDDYIFEFYCYVKILSDLKKNYIVKLVPGTAGGIFPKAPAKKDEGWSHFNLFEDNIHKFQVCCGTDIAVSSVIEVAYHPDISFQVHDSPDNPNETHVLLIMDAKYSKNKSRLTQSTITEFFGILHELALVGKSFPPIRFDKFESIITANALLTNGTKSSIHEKRCNKNGAVQVERFDAL